MSLLERVYKLTSSGGIKLGLDNMYKAMDLLALDMSKIKIIHVAGTNGKGSTSAILQSLIMNHIPKNKKTGLYTSPHLISFNERIKIDNDLISDVEFDKFATIIFEKCKSITLTFFEFTTLIGFMHFTDNKVDYAVIETGLGGRLDSTNIVKPEICIITSIGIDHTEYLGNTIELMAFEKAGIFKKDAKIILSKTSCSNLLRQAALEKQAGAIYELEQEIDFKINKDASFDLSIPDSFFYTGLKKSLNGKHQYYNAATAITALNLLGINADTLSINKTLANTVWNGRLQEFKVADKTFYIDISHNVEGVNTLIEFLKSKHSNDNINIACGFVKDKDYKRMIDNLSEIANKLFVFPVIADNRSTTYNDYVEITSVAGYKNAVICHNFAETASLMEKEQGVFVYTGSSYSYETVYNYIKEKL